MVIKLSSPRQSVDCYIVGIVLACASRFVASAGWNIEGCSGVVSFYEVVVCGFDGKGGVKERRCGKLERWLQVHNRGS